MSTTTPFPDDAEKPAPRPESELDQLLASWHAARASHPNAPRVMHALADVKRALAVFIEETRAVDGGGYPLAISAIGELLGALPEPGDRELMRLTLTRVPDNARALTPNLNTDPIQD